MKRHLFPNPKLKIVSTGVAVAILTLILPGAHGQSPPMLQITSPTEGAVVSPGTTLSVTVTSPANATFTQVAVIGGHVGLSSIATSVPAQVSLAIPLNTPSGQIMLTAEGITTSGQSVDSATVFVDVEMPNAPNSLSTPLDGLFFSGPGDQFQPIILANFNGTTLEVTHSSHLSFVSSNRNIATVDANGLVTAVAPGSGYITARYTLGSVSIPLAIRVSVPLPPGTVSTSNFSLSITPASGGVTAGGTTSFTVSSNTDSTFTGIVTLNVDGLPSGATANFSPTSINVPGSSTLTISTLQSTPVETDILTISGVSGNLNQSASATLTVNAPGSAPAITSLSPNSGALGTSITITGMNFGSTQGSSTITFNGTTATPTSWSATSIVAPVPSGATTGNVIVTVGGVASNGVNFTVQGTTNGIALVQSAGVDAGTTTSYSLRFESNNNTAGNWIAVCIRAGLSGQTFTVTDSNGNSYRQAVQINDTLDAPNGNTLAIFYAENVRAGANTVTVSDTTSGTLRFAILEYTGVATANSLDVIASAQGSSTSPNSGNATTTASGDLLLGAVVTADARTFTPPTGVQIRQFIPGEPGTKLIVEDSIQAAPGTAAATATLSGESAADPWGAVLAAFKKAHP